ncbi:hypothetical protein GGF46_003577 [Coemansia sp. RSA 552]|nr:hypothetical protein GGF46_003577 [Coemansia sp. RSA 552]
MVAPIKFALGLAVLVGMVSAQEVPNCNEIVDCSIEEITCNAGGMLSCLRCTEADGFTMVDGACA